MIAFLDTIYIQSIEDKEGLLTALTIFTDDDFNGNNNESDYSYNWECTDEGGFNNNQEYVLDLLRKSSFEGEDLIKEYLKNWLEEDSFYGEYQYKLSKIPYGEGYILSVCAECAEV